MRAYQFAVYLALVGGIVGGVDAAMQVSDHPWFQGMNTHEVSQRFVPSESGVFKNAQGKSAQDQADAIGAQPQMSDATDTGSWTKGFSIGFVLWDMLKGVFYVKGIIDQTIVVPNPAPGRESENMFGSFSLIIQLGIWAIYGMGGVQYWNKTMLKYAY